MSFFSLKGPLGPEIFRLKGPPIFTLKGPPAGGGVITDFQDHGTPLFQGQGTPRLGDR
ncbi:MAG: hypothetical protein NVS3B1_29470 [Marmoricola sp.]